MKNYKGSQGGTNTAPARGRNAHPDSFRVEFKPTFLVDRLCEQLAFERNTIRLYTAMMHKPASKNGFSINRLEMEMLRDEKLDHFLLLLNALKELGEDPAQKEFSNEITCFSPKNHLKILSDRKVALSQCLSVLLEQEQTNWDGWQLLIPLAKNTGYEAMSKKFEEALLLEEDHLRKVRLWISQGMVFAESKAA